jgi:hypothetical protein
MQAEVPPAMIEIDAVGAIAILQLKRSITPMSAASGQGPRSCASIIEASSTWARMCLKILRFQLLAIAPSNGRPRAWRKEWKPITPRPTCARARREYLARAISSGARAM